MRTSTVVTGLCALALAACVPAPDHSAGAWVPKVAETWQIQLSGTVDTSVDAAVYDIDGSDNSSAVVAALHAKGRHAICYVSAGSWEDWRPDASQFPASVKGKGNGWPGEKWLDIRQIDTLRPVMAARFDMCKAKGFDGVDPDNVDGYSNSTGFPLSSADQIAYNKMLAGLAHDRGLAVGLKNDLDQVPALVGSFDFAVNEQCYEYDECDALKRFIAAGKPVFHVEYSAQTSVFCPVTTGLKFSTIRKKLSLNASRQSC
jgi:hypothetical protein